MGKGQRTVTPDPDTDTNRPVGWRLAAVIVTAVAAVVLLVGFLAYPRTSERHLSPEEFAALAAREGTVLLDVRSREEFAQGHLEGARNLDIASGDLARQLAGMDRSATYAVYCCTGRRSAAALETMRDAGFTHVSDLDGGITRWIREGRKVVTG